MLFLFRIGLQLATVFQTPPNILCGPLFGAPFSNLFSEVFGSPITHSQGIWQTRALSFSRWWFQTFVIFTPKIVHLPHFDKHIFSDGLVQPPTSLFSVKRTFRYSQPSLPWLTMFCFSHILGEAHMSLVRSSGRSQPLFERPGCICLFRGVFYQFDWI